MGVIIKNHETVRIKNTLVNRRAKMRIERNIRGRSKCRQPHFRTTRKIRSAQRAFVTVDALHQFTKTSLMERMSARQCTPAAIIGAMLIKTNRTFSAHDFSYFKSSDHFHGCCLIELGLLGIFVLIIQHHDCCTIMPWSFRFIHVVKVGCCTRSTWQTDCWQAHAAVRNAGTHRQ